MPVGSLAAWIEPARPEDSIQAIARELANLGQPVMPVAENHLLIGGVSEAILRTALAEGADKTGPISTIIDRTPTTISSSATGAEALRVFESSGNDWAIVVDQKNEPIGVITPSRLFEQLGTREFQGRVGGMATPFGVYLTNGIVSSGASRWALVATGALMSVIFHVAGMIVITVQNSLPVTVQNSAAFLNFAQISWMALFFIGLRVLPLSGTHGAEHMVVHAIERGEELRPEIVARMPRVHPRCGTNLAVGAMLFLSIMSFTMIPDAEIRLLLAMLTTIVLWQPLGSLLQLYVTTRKPSPAQLADGIRAGRQFLERAGGAKVARSTIASRLAMSGLFQVLLGSASVALLFWFAYEVLRVPLQWRVS